MNTVGWCVSALVAAVLIAGCGQEMVSGTPGPTSGSDSTTSVTVTSAAMLPTLRRDEKVRFRSVGQDQTYRTRPGDIVLVTPPAGWRLDEPKQLILRVIAVDGQRVECCDARNRVMIDGAPLDETYLAETAGVHQQTFGPVAVPANYLWLMGDNRDGSVDSRTFLSAPGQGVVPAGNVVGVLDPPR